MPNGSKEKNSDGWIKQGLESLLDDFETAWQRAAPPDLDAYLKSCRKTTAEQDLPLLLEELIKIDMEYRWRAATSKRGTASGAKIETVLLEAYILRYPEVTPSLELVLEEYRIRHRWGDAPPSDNYLRRFAGFADVLPAKLLEIEQDIQKESTHHSQRPDTDVALASPQDPQAESSVASKNATLKNFKNPPPNAIKPPQLRRPMPKTIGRYEVESLLGEGAFGVVYLAYDPQLHRKVAVKTPHRRRMRRAADLELFRQEAQLAAQLTHPALVQIHDISAESGRCFLVMEYIEGESLYDRLVKGPLAPLVAAQMTAEMSDAVHQAHIRQLIHRDLKPGNILLDAHGQPHITDFGLAIREEDQHRRAGEVSGTPVYMAPEQVRGKTQYLDGRADIWSLGVMLYEMLTRRRPFTGKTVDAIFDEIKHREPKPPRQIDDSIPAELERICLKCLAKDITRRYTTAGDLTRDLELYLSAVRAETSSAEPGLRNLLGFSAGSLTGARRSCNLPAPPNEIVGRTNEINQVKEILLREHVGLVTLTGPGGMGKTRLALQLGGELLDQFPGGCWWVELSSATDATAVSQAVLDALGVDAPAHQASQEPVFEEIVATVLEYRKPLLLILDNFEQAVAHAQNTVGAWRRRAPHIVFLITSREPLDLAGEHSYELQPLETPPKNLTEATPCEAFSSVRFFRQCARQASSSFDWSEENALAVADICRTLEGIPLAMELAAARVKILKPAQILGKLDRKFQFLKSSRRDRAPRQRTLNGAIDWSYDLLTDAERSAFMQVCAFNEGFFLDTAEQVIRLPDCDEEEIGIIDVVQSLREKCLLRAQDVGAEIRFSMYQSIHEYGVQKWETHFSSEQQNALMRRLAETLVPYAESWSSRLHTSAGREALERLALEERNLCAVQDWALEANEPELAARAILAIAESMAVRGSAADRVARLERSLQASSTAATTTAALQRAALQSALSAALQSTGDWQSASTLADNAVAEAESLGASLTFAEALRRQAEMRRLLGQSDQALQSLERSLGMYQSRNDQHGEVRVLAERGFILWERGRFEEALHCYQAAEGLSQKTGDEAAIGHVAYRMGHLLFSQGAYAEALDHFRHAEDIARLRDDRRAAAQAISSCGAVFADRGELEQARHCFQQAEAIMRQLGNKRGIAVNRGNLGLVLSDQGEYAAALELFTSAESINREIGAETAVALNISARGVVLTNMQQYAPALQCLKEAASINREHERPLYLANNVAEQGVVYWRQRRYANALEQLREAEAILKDLQTEKSLEFFQIQAVLADVEAQLGQQASARVRAQKALELATFLGLSGEDARPRVRQQIALLGAVLSSD